MWARWILAIGLGAVLVYIGLIRGLIRQDITRSTPAGIERVAGQKAVVAGTGIASAGLALVALGLTTALSWGSKPLSYVLWIIVAAGVATFFLSIRR